MDRRRVTTLLIALATLAFAGASCSTDPTPPPSSPTPFFRSGPTGPTPATGRIGTGPTASGPTGASATGTTGTLPTSSPAPGTGTIDRGAVTVRVTGDVRITKTLRQLVSTVYTPPPGGLALVWTAGGTDPSTVGIGGSSFVGTNPTAPTLNLTITVPTPNGGFETFVSFDGECDVTIAEASASRVAGSFRCSSLASSSGVLVDVAATFSASG